MLRIALTRFFVQALIVSIQLFANDSISILQNLKLLRAYRTNDTDCQARSWERLTVNNMIRQAKRSTQCANLILKEVIQRLNQIKVNAFREGD